VAAQPDAAERWLPAALDAPAAVAHSPMLTAAAAAALLDAPEPEERARRQSEPAAPVVVEARAAESPEPVVSVAVPPILVLVPALPA
jgi:hypothetical protein